MFRRIILLALALASAGCGGGKTELNTTPLTDDQKQRIAEEDRRIAEEEGGKPVKAKPRR